MNNCTFTGNIGKEATVRYTPKNDAVAQFSLAVSSGYGEKEVTTWLNCSLWGKRAESLAPHLLRGTKIAVSGELTNRPYTDKQGAEKYSLELRINELTLLSSKGDTKPQASDNNAPRAQESGAKDPFDDLESNIPF